MAFNGSGTFLINTAGQPVVSGTVISSTAFNALTADLATGLSTAITKDGQTTVTANILMSTYKFTGLGVGSAATDSANLSQVQSTVTKLLNSVSGADTITATASPTLAAYAAGQMFYFVAAGDNTTSVTLNIDSLGAKAVTRDGSVALAAADIKSGEVIVVVYDGTRFQVVSQLNSAGDARFANVSIASSLYVGGVSTFVGNAGFSANVSIASALSVGGVAAITGATTIGGNLTLSGGTANGVLYLNGSKVATSGSALVFDGTNLGINCTATALTNYRGAEFAGTTATTGGFLRMRTSDSSINSLDFTDSNGRAIFTITNHPVRFGTNDTERMRLDSSGNLGIGTASPVGKLQVTGSLASFILNTSGTEFYNNYAGQVKIYTSNAAGFLSFGSGGRDNDVVLSTTGNLGIGTASPGYRLHVAQTSGNDIGFFGTSAGGGGRIVFSDGNSGTAASVPRIGANANDLLFYTNTSGNSATERARITSGGELLVGTTATTSGARLDVKGVDSTASNYCVFFENSGSNLLLAVQNDGRWRSGTAAASPYNFVVGATNRDLFVDNAGEIGYVSSVRASKTNIAPVADTDWLLQLNPVTFNFRKRDEDGNYTDEADGPIKHGLIAEEVEAVNSDLCFYDDEDKGGALRGVNYSHLITPMLKLIQKQQAAIAALEAKVTALESR